MNDRTSCSGSCDTCADMLGSPIDTLFDVTRPSEGAPSVLVPRDRPDQAPRVRFEADGVPGRRRKANMMGLIRKTVSVGTLGLVSFRSKKEKLRRAEFSQHDAEAAL